MDVVNQMVEVSKKWADLQVKTAQSWFEEVRQTEKFDPGLLLDKTIAASQVSIQGTLDAEVEGSEIYFKELVALPGLPKEVAKVVEPMHGVTKQFIGVQQSLANHWFEFLRKNDILKMLGPVVKETPAVKVAA